MIDRSEITKAVEDAYSLSALIQVVAQALENIEATSDMPSHATQVISSSRRTLQEVTQPLAGNCIDALELAERGVSTK